jgi:hypothetical protein
MPRAWIVLRRVWLALVMVSLGLVLLLPLLQDAALSTQSGISLPRWIFLSFTVLFFGMPHDDRDVIICSQRELSSWQAKSALGSLLVGLASFVCVTRVAKTPFDGGILLLGGVALFCLLAAPWFFRLCAWRMWAGMALLVMSPMV